MSFGPTEMIIVLVIVLVLFGGSQLPKLARSLGMAQKEFKSGLSDGFKDEDAADSKNSKDSKGSKGSKESQADTSESKPE